MKIKAQRKRYESDSNGICDWKKGDISEVKEIDYIPCCENAKEAFNENFIGFGETDDILNKNENVCIYKCFPYPEGACWDSMPIDYCPFCGAKIKIEIIG